MSEELLINVSPMESRVALLNDGVLREIYIERHNKMGLVGNIYVGTVVRVLPGMQAAFVDIGQSRTAFLHINDMQKIKKPKPVITNYKFDKQKTISNLESDFETNPASNSNDKNVNNLQKNDYSSNQDGGSLSTSKNYNNPVELPKKSVNENVTFTSTTQTHSTLNVFDDTQNDQKSESFFSSKQFPKEGKIDEGNENGSRELSVKNLVNQINQVNQAVSACEGLPTSVHALTSNADIMVSSKASEGNKAKLPKFTVLPTVNEILTKKSLTPSPEEQESDINVNDGSLENSTETLSKPKTKKQPQVNANELIQNRLREGQHILVQVTKDQLGTKGARLTTNISLPSRYLVYLPSADNIGISQRIDSEDERKRLKADLSKLMKDANLEGGLIARTAAENVPTAKLKEDIEYLLQLWRMVQSQHKKVHSHQSSIMVYQELSLPLRCLRDLVHEETERVVVDDARMYDYLRQFAHEFVPMILPRIVPYHSQQPMFDVYRVEEDLRDALKRRVNLKSGGYLIIDQTEAMTTIDVNTGSFVGGRSLEDTVYKTNLEATHAIARQLRLRNLGGIIILDFIDMQEEEHRDDVLISLQTQLSFDYARTNITQVSELGLVEMTRKRTRESLEQQLCEPCSTCDGKGFVKTAETVCFEIFREIMRCARTYNAPKQFTVVAHAAVIDLLLTSEASTVADLEYLIGRVITFEVENLYTQEQYDIVLD